MNIETFEKAEKLRARIKALATRKSLYLRDVDDTFPEINQDSAGRIKQILEDDLNSQLMAVEAEFKGL